MDNSKPLVCFTQRRESRFRSTGSGPCNSVTAPPQTAQTGLQIRCFSRLDLTMKSTACSDRLLMFHRPADSNRDVRCRTALDPELTERFGSAADLSVPRLNSYLGRRLATFPLFDMFRRLIS